MLLAKMISMSSNIVQKEDKDKVKLSVGREEVSVFKYAMRTHQFHNNSIIDFEGWFFSSLFSTKNNDEIVDTINFDVRVEVLTTFSLDLLRTGRRKDGNNMSLSNVSARRMENL